MRRKKEVDIVIGESLQMLSDVSSVSGFILQCRN